MLVNLVSQIIISVAIFDVGRYILDEEVRCGREITTPEEARKSLTKFTVIIVIAVSLEALLHLIKVDAGSLTKLLFPAVLFLVSICLLVGLGAYQRLSVLAELGERKKFLKSREVEDQKYELT